MAESRGSGPIPPDRVRTADRTDGAVPDCRTGAKAALPEPVHGFEPPGVWAYVDRTSVVPGRTVAVRVSAPSSYSVTVERLGVTAILDPAASSLDDRRDTEMVHHAEVPYATPQLVRPGSYVYVTGDPFPGRPITLASWVRLWRAPCIDTLQWAWSGIIGDFDYPERCRFALLVTHAGRLAAYVGDGGLFRSEWLHLSEIDLRRDLGRWRHLAMVVDGDGLRVVVDGTTELTRNGLPSEGGDLELGRLRIGATGEGGEASNFLDADVAMPFVSAAALDDEVLASIVADRGLHDPLQLGIPGVESFWALDEERGATVGDGSGNGRHGVLVNGGTWQIGGPSFDASTGVPGYDPTSDGCRGHGLRLAGDDLLDCGWDPATCAHIPEDAPSGVYTATIRLAGQLEGAALSVPFVVVRTRPLRERSIALLCATNTWHAYGRIPRDELRVTGLTSSFYTRHRSGRPYFRLGFALPIPRADPFGFESDRAARTAHSHLVRPERFAQAWLTRQGYPFECITDDELDDDPGLLARFRVLLICGHSEYWSTRMRDGVESYLGAGGRVLCMSGNTLFWRVSVDDLHTSLESRKISAEGGEWLPPSEWGERWHSDDGRPGGTWSVLGAPSREVIALDMQGMIDDGSPACFSPFKVTSSDHFLLRTPEPVPISEAGTIGEHCLNGPKASGYEMDAAPAVVGSGPCPPGMVVLASATDQHLIEASGISVTHGADIVYWTRPAGGEVVNAGSIAVSGALAVDPGIAALVRNVLHHFGVRRHPDADNMS